MSSTDSLRISCLAVALSVLASVVQAQVTRAPTKNLGVDAIRTQNRLLLGFVLAQHANGSIDCAVDRKWLRTTYPDLAAQVEEQEKKTQTAAKKLSIDRCRAWIATCTEEKQIRLKLFLQDELAKLEEFQPDDIQTTFVKLTLSAKELSKVTPAKPEQRHIAGLAYKHELPEVTTTATPALERQLKELGIDPSTETFDLTGKLPALAQESDEQWAARQALLEFEMVEGFELQGKGDTLMSADDPIDPTALLKEMSAAQNELLLDLAKELKLDFGFGVESKDKPNWKSIATTKATKQKVRGVLVQRLQQATTSASVTVLTDFLVRTTDGKWFTLYHAETVNDGSGVAKEELDRLRNDPNLKQLLPMIEAIGGQAQLDKALRQGAATAAALGEARGGFTKFRLPLTRSLLTPPIQIPSQ